MAQVRSVGQRWCGAALCGPRQRWLLVSFPTVRRPRPGQREVSEQAWDRAERAVAGGGTVRTEVSRLGHQFQPRPMASGALQCSLGSQGDARPPGPGALCGRLCDMVLELIFLGPTQEDPQHATDFSRFQWL